MSKARRLWKWVKLSDFRTKTISVMVAVIAAVILPQMVHMAGAAAGAGAALGEMLLPMHLPVLFIGLIMGPAAGAAAGILSPLVSHALTGMPVSVMLPFLIIELAGYGLAAGYMSNKKCNTIWKLLTAQIVGRAARAVAVIVAVYALGSQTIMATAAWTNITRGFWGIAVQILVLPIAVHFVEQMRSKRGM